MNILKQRWDLLCILVLTAMLFLPSLFHPFVSWDDETHLTENAQVFSLDAEHIQTIFRSEVNKTYIPLTILSFAVERHFFGLNPFVYHLDNLLLHLGVIALIYILILRLGYSRLTSSVAALLFAVHPMHVESVVWVTERKDVLYSLFYVLSLWQYVVYVQERKVSAYGWALTCAGLSILAKPMAISLPLILCLLDWLLRRPLAPRLVFEKLPFVGVVFSVAWITYAMNMRVIDLHFPQAFLTWTWCAAFYLLKFLFPFELLVLYQLPQPVTVNNFEFVVALVFIIGLIGVLIRFRSNRTLLFAAAYFFLSIFFLLRFDNQQDLTIVADRFMYLPSLGLCLFLGWCAEQAKPQMRMKREIIAGLTIVLFILAVLTFNRVRLWGNEQALWEQVIHRYDNGLAYAQLGNYFLRKADLPEALHNYQLAIQRLPSYSKPYSNRGIVMLKTGRYDDAVTDFTRAIELEPKEAAITFNNRGYAYMLSERYPQALADYDHAVAIDGRYVAAYLNRATLYKNQSQYELAMNDLETVLKIDGTNAVALNNIPILQKLTADEKSR